MTTNRTWGTTKTHGLTVGDTFQYGGGSRNRVGTARLATVVEISRGGIYVTFEGDDEPTWLGGVATRYWAQAVSA